MPFVLVLVLVLGAVIQAPRGRVIKNHPSALGMSQGEGAAGLLAADLWTRHGRATGVSAARAGGWGGSPQDHCLRSRDPGSHQAKDSRSPTCAAVRAPWGLPCLGQGQALACLWLWGAEPQPLFLPDHTTAPQSPRQSQRPADEMNRNLRTRGRKTDPPPTASAPPTAHVPLKRQRSRACRSGCRHPQGRAPLVSSPRGPPALWQGSGPGLGERAPDQCRSAATATRTVQGPTPCPAQGLGPLSQRDGPVSWAPPSRASDA